MRILRNNLLWLASLPLVGGVEFQPELPLWKGAFDASPDRCYCWVAPSGDSRARTLFVAEEDPSGLELGIRVSRDQGSRALPEFATFAWLADERLSRELRRLARPLAATDASTLHVDWNGDGIRDTIRMERVTRTRPRVGPRLVTHRPAPLRASYRIVWINGAQKRHKGVLLPPKLLSWNQKGMPALAVGDWDADGRRDLFVGCPDGSVRVHRRVGPAELRAHEIVLPRTPRRSNARVFPTDWDRDGRCDLIVTYSVEYPKPNRSAQLAALRSELASARTTLGDLRRELRRIDRSKPDLRPAALDVRAERRGVLSDRIRAAKQRVDDLVRRSSERAPVRAEAFLFVRL